MSSPEDRKLLGEHFHRRLLSGSDLTVSSEAAEEYLPALVRRLKRNFPMLPDPHLVETAANDALLDLIDHPERFEPSRSSLFTYLYWRARSYLLNSLGRGKGSPAQEKVVELDDPEAVYKLEAQEADAETLLISREYQAGIIEKLRRVFTDPGDLRVVVLRIEWVRETSAYAEALGVANRPEDEQKKLVKKAKDRIEKILERRFRNKERGR